MFAELLGVRLCVRAHAPVHACMRACVHACMLACLHACVFCRHLFLCSESLRADVRHANVTSDGGHFRIANSTGCST